MIRRSIYAGILFIFLFNLTLLAQFENLTVEQWQTDLKFLKEQLETMHPDAWFRYERTQWEEDYNSLYYQIPLLTNSKRYVRIMQLVAKLQDGHTRARALDPKIGLNNIFPFRTYWFSDGLYIVAAASEYQDIVGCKIIKFGIYPAEQALKLASSAYSYDNEFTRLEKGPLMLLFPKIVHALGITDQQSSVVLQLKNKDGIDIVKTINADYDLTMNWRESGWFNSGFALPLENVVLANASAPNILPLYLRNPSSYYWYSFLPEQNTFYFQFNVVGNTNRGDGSEEPFSDFCARMFASIDTLDVQKMIIDLRLNSGGNNQILLPLIHGIIRRDKINIPGKLFTITGRRTFSAAMSCTGLLEKHTNTLFVGEPSGSLPNQYGDARTVTLPNSGLNVSISSVWWMNTDALDRRELIPPHIPVQLSSAHFAQNSDPVVGRILDIEKYMTLEQKVLNALREGSISSAKDAYLAYKKQYPDGWRDTKAETNRIGYILVNEKRLEEAIAVFTWNIETYPEYANGWDSLGEGYMIKGDYPLAIKYYKKSLELNPDNTNATQMIERMRSN